MCDATKCDDCGKHSRALQQYEDSWKYICSTCEEKRKQEVTHIVRLDFGEIEIKIFCKMVPPDVDLPELQRSALILERALTIGKERGMVPPDEDPNYIEIHQAPEYDEE